MTGYAPAFEGFNSRAREGRDEMLIYIIKKGAGFQSTRPRGARPEYKIDKGALDVSIHAPARGATAAIRAERRAARVSIHAPARGATFFYSWR